jgi:hypothetical protein
LVPQKEFVLSLGQTGLRSFSQRGSLWDSVLK